MASAKARSIPLGEQAGAIGGDGRGAAQVGLEEAHGAERQGDGEDVLAAIEIGELRRAASHVDEERAQIVERHAARDRQLDETRLLDPLDDLELDPRFPPGPLGERRGVGRFAHGAGGGGAVGIDLVLVHGGAKVAERGAGLTDGAGCQLAGDEHLAAETHRSAQAGDLLPRGRTMRRCLDDPQTERVGAEIERCKTRHRQRL